MDLNATIERQPWWPKVQRILGWFLVVVGGLLLLAGPVGWVLGAFFIFGAAVNLSPRFRQRMQAWGKPREVSAGKWRARHAALLEARDLQRDRVAESEGFASWEHRQTTRKMLKAGYAWCPACQQNVIPQGRLIGAAQCPMCKGTLFAKARVEP